jgi:hypothetical protein
LILHAKYTYLQVIRVSSSLKLTGATSTHVSRTPPKSIPNTPYTALKLTTAKEKGRVAHFFVINRLITTFLFH